MEIIEVSSKERFLLSSTLKGNQMKWFKDNKFIKADMMGYEGLAEAFSCDLEYCIKSPFSFVDYFMCDIHEKQEDGSLITYKGCYSRNCLNSNESMMSLYRIMKIKYKDLDLRLKKLSGLDLVNFVVSSVLEITGVDIYEYLGFLTKLDCLILNEDRHLHNISLVLDSSNNTYRISPVFDNGLSLLSDVHAYPYEVPMKSSINKVKAKPFSKDFVKQVKYFDTDKIKIDYNDFQRRLNSIDLQTAEYKRVSTLLKIRLKMFEGILWERI